MSVMKKKIDDLPKDAVTVSEQEALQIQLEFINEWKKSSEVWPLRSGVSILGFAAAAAGMYINGHYRRKLRLMKIGLMTTYLPIVVMPAFLSGVLHKMIITYDIVLEKTKCPVCLQLQAAAMQASIGCIYPLILAPLGNFMYATRHATYRLPDITKDYFGAARILVKFARPIGTQLSLIFVGQALLGSYFTYMEGKSYYTVKKYILEMEREYDESLSDSDNEKV